MRGSEMTGRKTLVIHTGDHKTGSTAIQAAFAQGRVKLADRMVFYPAKKAHNMLKGQCLAYGARNKPAARKRAITAFTKLAGRISGSGADFSLISAEALEGVDPGLFHDIVHRYFADTADDIRVVAYVRPHSARLLSSFAEQTKIGGFNQGLEPFFEQSLKKRRFHFQPRFAGWRAAFGDAFTLRPMIRDQLFAGSVVDDFIHHGFGVDDFTIAGSAVANESLCLEDLMRLKVLQSRCMHHPQKLRHALGWEFARLVASQPPGARRTRLTLHKTLAVDIRAAYLEDARSLDQQFFDGAPLLEKELDKAVDTAPQVAQPVAPEDHFSPDELSSLHLLSDIIAGMLDKTGDDSWVKFLRARRVVSGSAAPGSD